MRRFFLLLALAGCATLFAARAQAGDPLTLMFSANTVGWLLPCPS
ncbi:MAG: hypothetical protein AB1916_06530 [Thermodesulfobacteriota bacterium]